MAHAKSDGSTPRFPVRVNPVHLHPDERRAQLADGWRFRLDPDDVGVADGWHARQDGVAESITVPGCWQGQGFGDDSTDEVWDFRLEARTLRATYKGTGWYATTFRVPDELVGGRHELRFGGVHPSAEFWLNGVRLGEHHQPFVPVGFDVGDILRDDADNDLVVRVSDDARELGFAFSWQGNWSGLYRPVEIVATGDACVEQFRLLPDAQTGVLRCEFAFGGMSDGATAQVAVSRDDADSGAMATGEAPVRDGVATLDLAVPGVDLWSPDRPALYRVDVTLARGNVVLDALSERTGFVRFDTDGTHLRVNEEPYYWRGTGEFLAAPETGSPDTDRDRLRRKLTNLRAYGYNYVRFQSYVQAPEYYDVADEVGLVIQSEMGMLGGWGGHNQWHVYAWPQPTPDARSALAEQWDATVLRDVNHPSANFYCMSNELGSRCTHPRLAWKCYERTRDIKPTALVLWTDGGWNPDLPADFVNAEANIADECPKPLIQHEYRWWSSFPDVRISDRYDGAMRPYAQDMARAAAREHGVEHTLEDAAANSQRLQLVEAKGKMELCRRDNPTLAGICHFNAMDTTPSPQGVIDEFFERKIASSDEWLRANGDTVVMCGLGFDERVYVPGDTVETELFVSDYSHPPLSRPVVGWRIESSGRVLDSGALTYDHSPFGTCRAGRLTARIPNDVPVPARARLVAEVVEGERRFDNEWDLWLLPADGPIGDVVRVGDELRTWVSGVDAPIVGAADLAPDGAPVVLTEELTEDVEQFVRSGGRAILAAGEGLLRPWHAKLGEHHNHYFFTPPANYPPYEDGHDGTIVQQHPALTRLMHEGFADLQFYRLMKDAAPMPLEPLGLNDDDPIVRPIHSFPVGRSLGYLVERRIGDGVIMLCALNLDREYPEAAVLLRSLVEYLASGVSDAPEMTREAIDAVRAGSMLS